MTAGLIRSRFECCMSVAVQSSRKHFCLQTYGQTVRRLSEFFSIIPSPLHLSVLRIHPQSLHLMMQARPSGGKKKKKNRTPSLYQIKLDFKLEWGILKADFKGWGRPYSIFFLMLTNPYRRPKPTSQSFNAFWIPLGLSAAISQCCSCLRKQVGSIYFHFLKRLQRNNFLTAGRCSFRKHYSEHLGCIIFRSVVRNQNTVCGMTQYKLCVCVCFLCNEGAGAAVWLTDVFWIAVGHQ